MTQPLEENKDNSNSIANTETPFINTPHEICSSMELFNNLQFFEQRLYIDIRSKKEYNKNHIRLFINAPRKCKKRYAIKQIKKSLSSMYKHLFIDIYCYSNEDSINNKQSAKWYKYIHQLLYEQFNEYSFRYFRILHTDYITFSNIYPLLITKQTPKQYGIFIRYPNIIIDNKLYLGDGEQAINTPTHSNTTPTHSNT
eukprot:89775_1